MPISDPMLKADFKPVIDYILSSIRQNYPNWQSFGDPDFVRDETLPKRQLIERAKKLLSAEELHPLVNDENWPAVMDRIDKVCQSPMLYRSTPNSNDAGILDECQGDVKTFALAFIELIHGEGPSETRLDHFSGILHGKGSVDLSQLAHRNYKANSLNKKSLASY